MSHIIKEVHQRFRRWRCDDSTDLLFIWIPKSAGTSVYRLLRDSKLQCSKLLDRNKRGVVETSAGFKNKGAVTFGHTSVDQLLIDGVMTSEYFESAFKFCFVRNPWDRLVSLYYYLGKEKQFPDFRSFCLDVTKEDLPPIGIFNVRGNSQCNDQASWILGHDGRLLVDYIGRFERLNEDMDHVCKMFGLRHNLPHKNKTARTHYRDYYDDETVEAVRQRYKRDIELFGYDY